MPQLKKQPKESDDIKDIMAQKLEEHKQEWHSHEKEAKEHAEKAKFHKERVEYLTTFLSGIPTQQNGQPEGSNNYDKAWYWEKILPQFINTHFGDEEFRNANIIAIANIPGIDNDDFRKKVRYAVSMALSALVESGMLTYRREIGTKGYIYKIK